MFKLLFELFMEMIRSESEKNKAIDDKVVAMVSEIDKLEIELAEEISYAERWGDLSDNSHWRTAEVNRIKRTIEAKRKTIRALKNIH